jgi:hypothetical protein
MMKLGLLVAISSVIALSSAAMPALLDGDLIFALSIVALLVALIPRLDHRPEQGDVTAPHARRR